MGWQPALKLTSTMWEIKVWVLIGALAVTTTVISFLVKVVASNIINKIDELVKKIEVLLQENAVLKQEMRYLQERDRQKDSRLNNHAERLRAIEISNSKK